jgi:hypothetical protein
MIDILAWTLGATRIRTLAERDWAPALKRVSRSTVRAASVIFGLWILGIFIVAKASEAEAGSGVTAVFAGILAFGWLAGVMNLRWLLMYASRKLLDRWSGGPQ